MLSQSVSLPHLIPFMNSNKTGLEPQSLGEGRHWIWKCVWGWGVEWAVMGGKGEVVG